MKPGLPIDKDRVAGLVLPPRQAIDGDSAKGATKRE
jgi:hypothetical protein